MLLSPTKLLRRKKHDVEIPTADIISATIVVGGSIAAAARVLWAALARKVDAAETASAERHKACEDRAQRLENEIREMWLFQRDRLSELTARALHREGKLAELLGIPLIQTDTEKIELPRSSSHTAHRRPSGIHQK